MLYNDMFNELKAITAPYAIDLEKSDFFDESLLVLVGLMKDQEAANLV